MNDITLAELIAALPADVATSLASVSLPPSTTTAEWLAKILTGANTAAITKNQTLAAGERVNSYGVPAFSGAQVLNGAYFVTQSITLSTRVPLAFDSAYAVNS
jgi:hypothetical protein